MPYIKAGRRLALKPCTLTSAIAAGELNYQITLLCRRYFEENGEYYATINDVLGALEGAKFEFYRRVAAPYEDKKIKENGDLY